MEIILLPAAQEHLLYWQKENQRIIIKKMTILIEAILKDPYNGIGKPEPLKFQLSGKWSRRIDKKNRLIYLIENDTIFIYSCKGHYL